MIGLSIQTKRHLIAAAVCFFAAFFLLYTFLIEPYWIEVTHHHVQVNLSSPLKIAHVTDLHTYGLGRRERKLLSILDRERPDLIAITGDLIDTTAGYAGCHELLKQMHAPLGIWVVHGNHEVWWPTANERSFYESAGARLLVNSADRVSAEVWLVGLDDSFAGSPDLERALAAVPPNAYRIALFHSPAFFDRAAGRCELALAGHTHGGQLRLPVIGPLWLPPESGNYLEGWFENRNSKMYVSRGIGTSILSARFMSRPEVAVITVGE